MAAPKVAKAIEHLVVPIDTVREDPKNLRLHDNRNLDLIASSLAKFGQQKPIVVRDGVCVAGSGTLQAARDRLGWNAIAVTEFSGDERAAREYGIVDNRSTDLSQFDVEALGRELQGFGLSGNEFEGLGFTLAEAEALFPKENDLNFGGDPGGEHGDDFAEGQSINGDVKVTIKTTQAALDREGCKAGLVEWCTKWGFEFTIKAG